MLVESNSVFPLGPWLLKALLFLESPTKFPDGPKKATQLMLRGLD